MTEKQEDKTFEEEAHDVWDELTARDEEKTDDRKDDQADEKPSAETTKDVGGDVPGGKDPDIDEAKTGDREEDTGGEEKKDLKASEGDEKPKLEPPQHWNYRGEDLEGWNELPEKEREFMISREKRHQTHANNREQEVAGILRALDPVREDMDRMGVSEAQGMRNLIAVHLNLKNPETRVETILKLHAQYEITPEMLIDEEEVETKEGKRVAKVEDRMNERDRQEAARVNADLEAEVRELRESGDVPYWDELLPVMYRLHGGYLATGQNSPSPKELYAEACRLNTGVAEKMQKTATDQKEQERLDAEVKRARKGQTASGTKVDSSTPVTKAKEKEPASLEDELGANWDDSVTRQQTM